MQPHLPGPIALDSTSEADVLDSWKAIAQYLRRDIRTLQRWESTKNLPVRRMPGGDRPGVYALRSELDAWRRGRDIHLAGAAEPKVVPQPAAATPSVAVLPFIDLAGDKEKEYFGDGLADEIITALARVPGLRVTARTSSFAFRGKDQDIRKIASSLNAGAILEGSVRRSGSRIRVTAQLINAADGYHLWSQAYDREMAEIFGIQEDVSRAIVEALRIRLVGAVRPAHRRAADPEAYRLWLKGRYHCIRHTPDELLRSRAFFTQSAALDPSFPPAWLGIAESWWQCAAFGLESPREAVSIGRLAVARTLELDESSGEAHAMLGIYSGLHDFDWAAAEREFNLAVDLGPTSPEVHLKRAAYLLEPTARVAEAEAELETALELDPLSPVVLTYLGQCLMFERRYEEAIERLEEAAEIDPGFWLPRFVLFGTYAFMGNLERSFAIGQHAVGALGPNPMVLGAVGGVYGMCGRREEAEKLLGEIHRLGETRYVSPLSIAWVYLGLGDAEHCLEWLEKAVEAREPQIMHLAAKPLYDGFRADPRFQALIARMGLKG